MWKALQKSPPYFIKFSLSEDLMFVGVTDHQRYWNLNASRKSFLADLKESNEGLEFDDENELIERGIDMLSNPESLKKVSIISDEHGKFLTISMTKAYECPLKLELGLLEASTEHFFKSVVQPLLQTVCDLRSSQHELRELLKKKDREIEEYKIEGRAPRRLITTIYDDAAHMMKHTTFEENYGVPDVPALLEATAYNGLQKDKQRPATLAAELNKKKQITTTEIKIQEAFVSTQSPEQNAKIEKSSQNTLNDEITPILPPEIEETEIPGFVVKTNVEDTNGAVSKESLGPLPTKRAKTRLKY